MAISTKGITLMVDSGEGYNKLVDIKTFPDIGGAVQTIETTTLSDDVQKFIMGVKASAAMEFTANYTEADFAKVNALAGPKKFALYFGEDGVNGKFAWEGEASCVVVGSGVNAVVEMKITIVPSTAISIVAD